MLIGRMKHVKNKNQCRISMGQHESLDQADNLLVVTILAMLTGSWALEQADKTDGAQEVTVFKPLPL